METVDIKSALSDFQGKKVDVLEAESIVTIDGVSYPVTADFELTYNGNDYVVFPNAVNVRQHLGGTEVKDLTCDVWALIRKDRAIEIIQYFVNFFPILDLRTAPNDTKFGTMGKLAMLLNDISKVELFKGNITDDQSIGMMIQTFLTMLEKTSEENLNNYFNFEGQTALDPLGDNRTISNKMRSIRRYIVLALSCDENVANYRSLSALYDVFLTMYGVLINSMTYSVTKFCDVDQLIIHEMGMLLESIISDRVSKILFIAGKSEKATRIWNDMKNKYPAIKDLHSESDINTKLGNKMRAAMIEENKVYKVMIFPHMWFYQLPDAIRMKKTIKAMHEILKSSEKIPTNALPFETFYDFIITNYKDLSNSLTRSEYGLYPIKMVVNLIANCCQILTGKSLTNLMSDSNNIIELMKSDKKETFVSRVEEDEDDSIMECE